MSPFFAVIFGSQRTSDINDAYEQMAARMVELAQQEEAFISLESVRSVDGRGITISYWKSLEGIQKWKRNCEHLEAQEKGKSLWYSSYSVRVCQVLRSYDFDSKEGSTI